MRRLRRLLSLLSICATLPACLPTNNFGPNGVYNNNDAGGLSNVGLSDTASDGAKPPCTQYDPSTPTRAICVSCYNSVLSTRCPGKSAFSSCIDPTVKTGYPALVNTCISQSTLAGFTCSVTCSNGQVINPQTCTCIQPTPGPPGEGTGNVDVGQTDFGPPIVTARYPGNSLYGTPTPTPTPTECVGDIPFYLSVQNRGNTVFRLNQYGDPRLAAEAGAPTPRPSNANGTPYITQATKPVNLTTTELANHPGSNVLTTVTFHTGGDKEIRGVNATTGSRVGNISTISGTKSDGLGFLAGGATGDDQWTSPSFGARDRDGNLYFSDSRSHVVVVICYNPTGGSPHCSGVTAGHSKIIAGVPGVAGSGGDGAIGTSAHLNSPHGIAVSSNYLVYVADSGNHTIRVICHTGCTGGAGLIWTVAGEANVPSKTPSDPAFGTHLNFPYGVDADGNNLYIADYQNHMIRTCNYGGNLAGNGIATGICSLSTMVGNGQPGYVADGGNFTGTASVRYPTDVKKNWNGNFVYADSGNHVVRAICNNGGDKDFCDQSAAGTIITLAGSRTNPIAGNFGEGSPGYLATISSPYQILLGKQVADDVNVPQAVYGFDKFRDNNVLFTEKLLTNDYLGNPFPSTVLASGNTTALTGISEIAMGIAHTCYNYSNGTVVCMGDNANNQIGSSKVTSGQTSAKYTVANVTGVSSPGGMRAGANHTCAITTPGNGIQCWGQNGNGQLGNNTTTSTQVPVGVIADASVGTPAWSLVAPGAFHTCAYNGSAAVYCWGDPSAGQLGTGPTPTPLNQPKTAVSGYSYITAGLASGSYFTCASPGTTSSNVGEVYCWGDNSKGQIGNAKQGNAEMSAVKVSAVPDTNNEYYVAAGDTHACAWNSTNGLWCWGSNDSGQLGRGTSTPFQSTPAQVSTFMPANNGIQVALGTAHTCAITSSGSSTTQGAVYCWGDNSAGQLGNDDIPLSSTPVQVVGIPVGTIKSLAAHANRTCATIDVGSGAAGTVYCWGDNQGYPVGILLNTFTPTGNTVKIICGDNSAAAASRGVNSSGYCEGMPTPSPTLGVPYIGGIHTISGQSGIAGNRNVGDGSNARQALHAKASGLTYDGMKNLIVSSSGFIDASGKEHFDFSLRRISGDVVGPRTAVRYTFTDSNGQTSYYCLRLKPLTECDSSGACSCAMAPPTDDPDPNFWDAINSTGIQLDISGLPVLDPLTGKTIPITPDCNHP